MTKRRHTYQITITETLRYAATVKARSRDHAERLGADLWHEQMQMFRCISDGGIEAIHVQRTGSRK
ncbi:MAG: hypothetical protein CTY31_14125 [Hyphomicrobium sp.]|nr:MAG: hypothetical protein CTY31_14125 [Hyphomicrobium sp.]